MNNNLRKLNPKYIEFAIKKRHILTPLLINVNQNQGTLSNQNFVC